MSHRRKGDEKFCNKTLESYKQVLDSMVNFLGASGALLRQRIETGQITGNIDCEVECVACSPQMGIMCAECSRLAQQATDQGTSKECAAAKLAVQQAQGAVSTTSTSTDKQDSNIQAAQGVAEPAAVIVGPSSSQGKAVEPLPTTSSGNKDSSVCICAQVRKIRDSASKVGIQSADSKSR